MIAFTPNEWLIIALIFVLGLLLGMFLMAGGKWKGRYREEARLRQEDRRRVTELEAENERLRREHGEMNSLRHAAARDEHRHRDEDHRGEDGHRNEDRHREDGRHGPL